MKRLISRLMPLLLAVLLAFPTCALATDAPETYSFRDYLISQEPVTIDNDRFSMTIPAGVPYHKDAERHMLEYMEWVEEATGLSFYPEDAIFEKVQITLDQGTPFGGDFGINLEPMDMLRYPDSGFAQLHELTHTLQYRLVSVDCQPFIEGIAIVACARAAGAHGLEYLAYYIASSNYAVLQAFEREMLASGDMEEYFRSTGEGWEAYLIGFRFDTYLEAAFGESILTDILRNYRKDLQDKEGTRDCFVDSLIATTSPTVFTDFQAWYRENAGRFEEKSFAGENTDTAFFMPFLRDGFRFFESRTLCMKERLTLDFHDSHAYAQFMGCEVWGIAGSLWSEKDVTIEVFDQRGELLDAFKLVGGDTSELRYADADLIVLTGEDGTVRFQPDIEIYSPKAKEKEQKPTGE